MYTTAASIHMSLFAPSHTQKTYKRKPSYTVHYHTIFAKPGTITLTIEVLIGKTQNNQWTFQNDIWANMLCTTAHE